MVFTFLARQYSKFIPQGKVIVITGSIDKSSTLLSAQTVLEGFGPVFVEESITSHPQRLLKLSPKIKKGLFEVDPIEIERSLTLIRPEVVIVTNILETEFSPEQTAQEVSKLISQIPKGGSVILNWDDPIQRRLAERIESEGEAVLYGTNEKKCHIWAGDVQISQFRVSFELNYGVERVEIMTNFISKHQIYPLLAAAALGVREGLRLTQIKQCLEKVKVLPHKMEVITGFNGSIIIDSSFDGALASTEPSIEGLNYIPARRRIVVLAPMQGRDLEKNYRKIAHKIYQDKVDLVLLAKGETKVVADELIKLGFIASRIEQDLLNPQIVGILLKILAKGDVVLIKGPKEVRLDEVVSKISKK